MSKHKQSCYGYVTLRIQHSVTLCQLKFAQRLAEEANERAAKTNGPIAKGTIPPFTAETILRVRGDAAVLDAPPHPDCNCRSCSPTSKAWRELMGDKP